MPKGFPLLAFSLAAYALLDWLTRAPRTVPWYDLDLFDVALVSGDAWHVTNGQVFVLVSLVLLFIELLRSTRVIDASNINHALSSVLSGASLVLFVTRPGYGNYWFFAYVMIASIDFIAGFIITTAAARRDVEVERVERHS